MEYTNLDELNFSKITLGTVQLSMKYGISNLTESTVKTTHEVLMTAKKIGISSFDTSPQYGNIEKTLGNFFKKEKIENPTVISKIPPIEFLEKPNFDDVYNKVKKYINQSLNDLNLKKIPVCLIHDPQDMSNYDGMVVKALELLKQNGHIKKIGCSVYTKEDVEKFLTMDKLEIIEIPINLFNTKIIDENKLLQLKEKNIIVLGRSIFLQGLFFLNPYNLPAKVEKAKKYLIELNKIANDYSIPIPNLALSFVNKQKYISSIIIGVENSQQLSQNIELANTILPEKVEKVILEKFANVPESVNNPLEWIKAEKRIKDNIKKY
jgi:aryl-alcohol dehydrogenase-like predicted oxidoreductase